MPWLARYRIRHYLENSICAFPILAIVLAMVTVRMLHRADEWVGWGVGFSPEAARAVLGILAGAMFTCVVFISSALLLVVQLASAQLTPRIIGSMFRDATTKCALTLFVF